MTTGYTVQPQQHNTSLFLAFDYTYTNNMKAARFSASLSRSRAWVRACGVQRSVPYVCVLSHMRAETFFPLRPADGGVVSSPRFDAAAARLAEEAAFLSRWFIAVAIAADA